MEPAPDRAQTHLEAAEAAAPDAKHPEPNRDPRTTERLDTDRNNDAGYREPSVYNALIGQLAALTTAVEFHHERTAAQESLISRMQDRIEELEADQVRALLGPIIVELAQLHAASLEAAAADFEAMSPSAAIARVRKELGFLASRIEEALSLLGAESLEAAVGVPFDSRLHQAMRRLPSAEPDLDGRIAGVQRQGFRVAGAEKPLLYAKVTVHAYSPELALDSPGMTDSEVSEPPPSTVPTTDDSDPEEILRPEHPAVTPPRIPDVEVADVPLPPLPRSN